MWMGYMNGPLNLLARLVLCVAGVLVLSVWPAVTAVGLALLAAVWLFTRRAR